MMEGRAGRLQAPSHVGVSPVFLVMLHAGSGVVTSFEVEQLIEFDSGMRHWPCLSCSKGPD